MENLTEALSAYTGCENVEFVDGVYFLRFLQQDRYSLRNILTDGTNLQPIMSTTPENRVRTFYLNEKGTDLTPMLVDVPIVFVVSSRLNEGIWGDYEHWTLNGLLHRDGGRPAYLAEYKSPNGKVESMMKMYFVNGVRKRDRAPSLELFKNFIHTVDEEGRRIMKFNQAIFECTYCPEEGDPTEVLSWPYVHRLTLKMGRQLLVEEDGEMHVREIAAKQAVAKWELHSGLGSGMYPTKMEMDGFHEVWNLGKLETRKVKRMKSWWIRINEEDKRELSSASYRRADLQLHNRKFDKGFRQTIERIGFTEKPFFDDPMIELGVLTDLPKHLGDDDDD